MQRRVCECGCGEIPKKGNRFINGHNNSFQGKKHTESTKRKLAMVRLGTHLSDETKQKMSKALKGRIVSEKTRKKISKTKTKEKHFNWKGGVKVDKDSRVYIRQGKGVYKVRSRIVMENHIKRELKSSELVHHINGDPSDDRIENLVILNRSKHVTHHNTGRKYSEETKRKIGIMSKGRTPSIDTRRKISESLKQTWKRRKNED